jgi:hypothetical protein
MPEQGFADNDYDKARPYGELTCDLPYATAVK